MADAADHIRVVKEMVEQDPLFRNMEILEIVEPANDDFGKVTLVLIKKSVTSAVVEFPVDPCSQTW